MNNYDFIFAGEVEQPATTTIPGKPLEVIPPGQYKAILYDLKQMTSKAGNEGLVFTFQIAEGESRNRKVSTFKSIPTSLSTDKDKYLQKVLREITDKIGIKSLDNLEQYLTARVYGITVSYNGEYLNIKIDY